MIQDIGCPDVTGYTLGEARVRIEKAGFVISGIKITSPPRSRHIEYRDNYRVLRINSDTSGEVELLVCNPDEE